MQKLNQLEKEKNNIQVAEQNLLEQTFSNLIKEKNLSAITKMTQAGYRTNTIQEQNLSNYIRKEYFSPHIALKNIKTKY